MSPSSTRWSVVCMAACAALAVTSASQAAPVTLDFNGASAFNTYSEDGYSFTAPAGWSVVSDVLVGQVAAGVVTTTLTESTNQPFDLLSMDDLLLAGTAGQDHLRVISSTGASVILTSIFETTPFSGPDWTNLTYVQFELTSVSVGASVRLDNIVVETVPAPASAFLGLACMGAASRRTRRPVH